MMCSGGVKLLVLSEPVLVGREEELEELQRSLDSVLLGKGKTIFISGKAGSGKTRLTNEFLNIARKRDLTILFGWCLNNTTLPYFPFIEAFNSEIMSRGGGTILRQPTGLKSWLSDSYPIERSEKDRTIVPQFWKDQAFTAVTKELLYLSSVNPVILVLEDIHWADSASLALLHYISRAIVNEKILILVTFRSEELGRDAERHLHPLAETLNLMGREGLFKEIQLENLNQEHVRGIAESMVGGRADPKLVERLMKESRGNPLFVVEFLRMLSEHGKLIREKNQWRLSVEKLGMPSKVKEVIMRRIGALRPNQRRVLDVASVIGDKFGPDLIAGVLSKDRLEILEMLNGIMKSTSLVRVEENRYMFDHAKSREVLYEEISSPLKRGYHERVAEQIETANKDSKEIPFNDLAYHFAQAGNQEKSVKYSLAAGQDALARFSNTEAIKHFSYALEHVANLDELTAERNIALEGLGDSYYANCMFEEAIKTFEKLAKSATGTIRLRSYRKAMDAAWFIEDDPSRMLQLVEKAEQYAALDPLEKARILMNKGRAYFKLGDLKAALRAHEEGLKILKEEYSLPDLARSLGMTGGQRIICGQDVKKGLGEIQRAISLLQELGNTRLELIAKVNRNFFFSGLGIVQELVNEYPEMLKVGERIGDFHSLAETSIFTSGIFEDSGKFEDAIALSLKALEYSRKTDMKSLEPGIYAFLTRQYARIGDLEKANHYFDLLLKIPPKILSYPMNAPWVAIAEAAIFAAKGQCKEADENFQKVFELSKKGMWQHLNFESFFRKIYIWALELQGKTEEAEIERKLNQERTGGTVQMFAHVDLQADLIMKKRIIEDDEHELRLDLVNVGRGSGSITKIEGLVPSNEFKVITLPSYCCLQKGDLEMGGREIGTFRVETIKLTVKVVREGVLSLNPKVIYVDALGESKTCKPQPIKIIVNPRIASPREKMVVETKPAKLEFKSEAAQKAFDFLVKAFVEDYFRKRLPRERSGWRTLMNIVKQAKVSQYSMYGTGGRPGLVTAELEKLGVVEVRVFFGEKGRGGKILKLRVSSGKENVKRYIDHRI
jgi:tetratricopeptide (TPR) repeat protein